MDPLVGFPKQTNFSMVADDGQSTTIAYDEPSNTSASVANSIFSAADGLEHMDADSFVDVKISHR